MYIQCIKARSNSMNVVDDDFQQVGNLSDNPKSIGENFSFLNTELFNTRLLLDSCNKNSVSVFTNFLF